MTNIWLTIGIILLVIGIFIIFFVDQLPDKCDECGGELERWGERMECKNCGKRYYR